MKIGLVGLGRTGKIVAEYLLHKAVLTMALCRPHSINANKDIGQILNRERTGILITSTEHLERQLFSNKPDVLIDFSCPQFLKEHLINMEGGILTLPQAIDGKEYQWLSMPELETNKDVQKKNYDIVRFVKELV